MNAEELREKVSEYTGKESLKARWPVYTVAGIFLLALYIRYLPEQGMQYLQALDPYVLFRNAQHLAYTGSLPPTDFLFYFPYNNPTFFNDIGGIFFPALMWWGGASLFFPSFLEWAQFYPALMGALSTVAMYFFGKEALDRKTGAAAAFFLAITPGVLRRSSAGFFEKEPIGTFFMMTTLYFFTRAWRRTSRASGVLSGLSLAFFTISWGGSQMMWLLLPLTVGSLIFINEEVQELLVAYTPTVLIGGLAAYGIDQNTFSLTGTLFVANMGLLGVLWARYLVEELELVSQDRLKYFVPGASVAGVFALILSPLFLPYLSKIFTTIMDKAFNAAGGGVIGSTVAENQAPSAAQVISSLGATAAGGINQGLGAAANFVGTFPLMMVGAGFLGAAVTLVLMKKYGLVGGEISYTTYTSGFMAAVTGWSLAVTGFFIQSAIIGVAGAVVMVAGFVAFNRFLDEDGCFRFTALLSGSGAVLNVMLLLGSGQLISMILPPLVASLGISVSAYFGDLLDGDMGLRTDWYAVLPLLFVASNLFAALLRSRLIFLSSFSVALVAGHGLARIVEAAQGVDLTRFTEFENIDRVRLVASGLVMALLVVTNVSAAYVNAAGVPGDPSSVGITGSPNQAWDRSLTYLEEETPPGSAVMSWWDYGYHLESIGRRPSIANGKNAGYYTQGSERAVNMPLADFLTSSDPLNTSGIDNFLKKHSVDYILLDNTMIGKYSAVSTISNRAAQLPNETKDDPQGINSISTPGNTRSAVSQSGNTTVVRYSSRGVSIGLPINITNRSVEISGAPSFSQRTRRGNFRGTINCVITEDGKKTFDVDSQVPYCVAQDPYYSLERALPTRQPARLALVPKSISDSTFVELYLGDGSELPWAEKIPEASNDYVKVWEVDR